MLIGNQMAVGVKPVHIILEERLLDIYQLVLACEAFFEQHLQSIEEMFSKEEDEGRP